MSSESRSSKGSLLSCRQEELWYRHQVAGGETARNGWWQFSLRGPLAPGRMAAALGRLVERQGTFRAGFEPVKGLPRQRVRGWSECSAAFVVHHLDLGGVRRQQQRRLLAALRGRLLETPFDLSQPPLLRALSVRLGFRRSRLLLVFPRLVADALSRRRFLRQLAAAYGNPGREPIPLPIQVAELALHEEIALAAPQTAHLERSWRRRLLSGAAAPELSRDPSPAAGRQVSGGPAVGALSFPLPAALRREDSSRRASLLLAALALTLGRWSGRSRLSLALVTEHRPPGAEELVGPLGNLLPVPLDPRPGESFAGFAAACRRRLEEARRLAAVPFGRWLRRPDGSESGVERLGRAFLRWTSGEAAGAAGGDLRMRDVTPGAADWPAFCELGFLLDEGGGTSRVLFDSRLFEGVTLLRFAGHLHRALEHGLELPRQSLGGLRWLSPAERHQLLREWSGAGREAVGTEGARSLPEAFRASVIRCGEAAAILVGQRRISYRALDQVSGALTRWLRAVGGRPYQRVALVVRDPLSFALGALAVARLGATVVPLDPRWPYRRLRSAMEQLELSCLVTDEASEPALPKLSLPVVVATFEGLPLGGGGHCFPGPAGAPAAVHLESPASSPLRAAVYSHRAVLERSRGEGLGAVAGLGDLSSEAVFLSLWSAFQQGRCWVGAGERDLDPPEALEGLFEACWIGSAFVAAAVYSSMKRGGSKLLDRIPLRCFPEIGTGGGRSTYLLDRHLRPVASGGPGRIWHGGRAVAQSLGDDPRRTAEELVPDPFSEAPGQRIEATGRSGSWTARGRLELCTGRPGEGLAADPEGAAREVEEHLRRHGAILDCEVEVERNDSGDEVLVAKVVRGFSRPREGPGRRPGSRGVDGHSLEELEGPARGRILQIGGGDLETALRLAPKARRFLYKVAPGSQRDWQSRVGFGESRRPALEVIERSVEDFGGLEEGGFDLVLISDVVPFLPGSRALGELLRKTARVLAEGGVACLSRIPCLWHAAGDAVQELLREHGPSLPLGDLEERVRRRLQRRGGFLLAPPYFSELLSLQPAWDAVRILPARSSTAAETFDVLLRRAGGRSEAGTATAWVDWRNGGLTLSSLASHLEERKPASLGLTGLRCRVWQGRRLWSQSLTALAEEDRRRPAQALTGAVAAARTESSGSVAEVLAAAKPFGYRGRLSWGRSGSDALLDLLLVRGRTPAGAGELWLSAAEIGSRNRRRNVHEPAVADSRKELRRRLLEHLRRELPEARLPARFDFVPSLASPAATPRRPGSGRPPRSVAEKLVASLWREALEVEECSAEDDFFVLGGSSRSAVRVVMGLREAFGVELPVKALFEKPTVAGLGAVIDGLVEAKLERVLSEAPLPGGAGGHLIPAIGTRGIYRNRE